MLHYIIQSHLLFIHIHILDIFIVYSLSHATIHYSVKALYSLYIHIQINVYLLGYIYYLFTFTCYITLFIHIHYLLTFTYSLYSLFIQIHVIFHYIHNLFTFTWYITLFSRPYTHYAFTFTCSFIIFIIYSHCHVTLHYSFNSRIHYVIHCTLKSRYSRDVSRDIEWYLIKTKLIQKIFKLKRLRLSVKQRVVAFSNCRHMFKAHKWA